MVRISDLMRWNWNENAWEFPYSDHDKADIELAHTAADCIETLSNGFTVPGAAELAAEIRHNWSLEHYSSPIDRTEIHDHKLAMLAADEIESLLSSKPDPVTPPDIAVRLARHIKDVEVFAWDHETELLRDALSEIMRLKEGLERLADTRDALKQRLTLVDLRLADLESKIRDIAKVARSAAQ